MNELRATAQSVGRVEVVADSHLFCLIVTLPSAVTVVAIVGAQSGDDEFELLNQQVIE